MNWTDRLKQEWNKDPLKCIMIGALAATAAAKVLDSMSASRSRSAYARQINQKTPR